MISFYLGLHLFVYNCNGYLSVSCHSLFILQCRPLKRAARKAPMLALFTVLYKLSDYKCIEHRAGAWSS